MGAKDLFHYAVRNALEKEVYQSFFLLPFGQASIEEHQLKLVVYEPDWEVITTWLE